MGVEGGGGEPGGGGGELEIEEVAEVGPGCVLGGGEGRVLAVGG